MRIALCSSYVPFINGGARFIVEWLAEKLREYGHEVELVYLPMVEQPDQMMGQMLSYRLMDLSERTDRIITTRPPAHLIQHPHKTVWFIHHFRDFYDMWDSHYRGFPDDARHQALRLAIHELDNVGLNEAKRVFANSRVVGDRLRKFNGVDSEVLYPPLLHASAFHDAGCGNDVVYVCRMEHHKRQHLLLEAFRHVKTPVRLEMYGACVDAAYGAELRASIAKWKLQGRVSVHDRWITEEEKIEVLSRCLAAAYVPVDEDSYGYPSLEASYSSKPVITTTDSGGVLELVENGVNGVVAEPDPQALAAAIDRLFVDKARTGLMGSAARDRLDQLNIRWDHVVERLLS